MNLAKKIANEFGMRYCGWFYLISFGATVYLMMDNKLVASFLSALAIYVSEFDLNLYTGRIGYLATERTGSYLRLCCIGVGRQLCRYVNFSLYFAANTTCQ